MTVLCRGRYRLLRAIPRSTSVAFNLDNGTISRNRCAAGGTGCAVPSTPRECIASAHERSPRRILTTDGCVVLIELALQRSKLDDARGALSLYFLHPELLNGVWFDDRELIYCEGPDAILQVLRGQMPKSGSGSRSTMISMHGVAIFSPP